MFSLRPSAPVVPSLAPVAAPLPILLPPLEPHLLAEVATVVVPSITIAEVVTEKKARKKKAVAGVDKPAKAAKSGVITKPKSGVKPVGEKKPRKPSVRRTLVGLYANYEVAALKSLKLKLKNKKTRLSEDAIVGLMYIHNAFIRATAAHAVRINSYRDKKTVNGFDVYEAKRLALARQISF